MTFHERAVGSPVASESGFGAAKDLEHEFARAFPSAEFNGAKLNESLRQAMHRFVDDARARGITENDVVVALKDIARRAGFARPDTMRPLASLPADRLFTRAITACLEMYHDADAVPTPSGMSQGNAVNDPYLDLDGFRALLLHNTRDDFVRAVGAYVRSAHARGLSMDQTLANVDRILGVGVDVAKQVGRDAGTQAHELVVRGLLFAVYGGGIDDVAKVDPMYRADLSAPRMPGPSAPR